MEKKNKIYDSVVFALVIITIILSLPYVILYFLLKLIATPYYYLKYRRCLYQKDFPHKYIWLRSPHIDSEPYIAIKKNNLPVEYIKSGEEYEMHGYFVYRDILLNFTEPFFFDKKKKLWLFWPNANDPTVCEDKEDYENDEDFENTDDCLSVEEAKKYILDRFFEDTAGRECSRVVFFYSLKNLKKYYDAAAMEAIREISNVIIYKKGELAKSITAFIEKDKI